MPRIIGDYPAHLKRQKRLHRAAYHRSRRPTAAQRARFVAESITLKLDEGRAWTWSQYGLHDDPEMQALVLAALKEL